LLPLLALGFSGASTTLAQGFRPDTLLPAAATVVGDAALTEFQRQPALLPLAPVSRYARTQVSYQREQGEFRLAQAPEQAQVVGASTEGYRDWHGFRLLGRFRYERQWLDSVQMTLIPPPVASRPYYPLARRGGNWDNQTYQLGAVVARQWGPLLAGMHLDLDLGDYARSNDPRPVINQHQLRVGGSVGYQLSPAWGLAGQYTYGYGREALSVQFANDGNKDGSDTPFSLFRLLGYGYLTQLPSEVEARQTIQQQVQLGRLSLTHQAAQATYLLTAEVKQTTEDYYSGSTTTIDNQISRNDVGRYTLAEQRLHATRLHQQSGGAGSYLRLTLARQTGRDELRVLVRGNNYLYTQQLAQLAAGWQRHNAAGAFTEVEADLHYRAELRADGTTQHRRQTRRAGATTRWQQRRPAGGSRWQALYGLSAALELDAGSGLQIPAAQQTFFSRAVAVPDYFFDRQHTLAPALRLGAERPLSSFTRLRVAADIQCLTPLTQRPTDLPATFVPNGQRWTGQLALTLYH
jgi:hypothetical protein